MELHIGQKIEQVYQDSGLKITEFAKRLNTSPRNLYSIFKRKTITVDMLKEIGDTLGYNFFELYANGSTNVASEPKENYGHSSQSIKMIIELDGEEGTLEKMILRLRKLNAAI